MWRLTVRPSRDSALDPVDVVVDAAPGTRVGDLATQLGEHLAGPGSRILLAPTSEGRPWAAGEALADCDLRDGDVLDVTDVADQWLSRPAAPRTLRAHVRVVDGPDAGTVVPADSDVVVLGRSARCTVRLSDPTVSREHARVLLAADPVVVDQGSAHGTFLDGRAVTGAQQAGWNTPIRLGRTTVVLVPAGAAVPARPAAVLRSPRFGPQVVPAEHDLPVPPSAPRKQPLPWPMMLMPLLMGGAMFATTRSTFSLIFMLGFPLMMLTSHLIQRRSARVEHEGEVVAWRTEVAEVMAQLDADARVQREQTLEDEPELDEVVARAAGKHHDVWNRQPDEDDFLHVRVGRGPRPALVTAKVPTSGDRALRAELAEAATRRATLSELPVPVRFADGGLTAVVGPDGDVDELLRALLVRLAVAHSPTDVAVRAVLGPERAHVESWLRWLPHAANGAEGSVAIGAARGQELLEALAAGTGPGHTVCLVDDGVGLPRRLVEAVAALGNEHLHLVWLGSDLHAVPAATGTALDVAAMQLLTARRGGVEPLTTLDRLDLASAWKAARHLTAYRDEAAVAAAELLLPPSVRLPEVSGDLRDPDDVGGVLERWASSTGLRAQLGAGADGPVTIDLREDGPHGLVAGTTGSGKSELLQSLICSLAMNNPPSRITFLLVDYKGGAAFRECADLPHSVGYITDLTPALVQRALVSLHAELTHREHLLAQHGAKDLVALERSHPEVAPPSMLICVDEFAALLAEVPEFVDGMVSIAQRGRSLGMHMLLATQRPAGVVTPQIKANTDLRIALRVASPEDSSDVIDSPDAAQLSRRTPGRAWLRRTGHGTRELVQVAWVGAHEERHEAGTAVRVEPFTALGRSGSAGRTGHLDPRTDLERLVETATTAFGRTGARPPRKPWLPPLPHDLALGLPGERIVLVPGTAPDAQDELLVAGTRADAHTVRAQDGQVVLGLRDDPARQTQEPWAVDYARVGHLLVFGASGSGKTELLRTLGASASASGEPGAPGAIVYGIDAGGGGLGVLETLPSVGSVVTDRAIERVLRLVRLLHRTVVERNEAMAARGVADLAGLADTGVQRIHLLIDNLPALLEMFEGGGALRRSHGEKLLTILQEGRRAGVHITATAPQRTGLPSQVQAAFGARAVLRMTSEDDYAMLGAPAGVLDAQSPPGRGLVGGAEVQVATLGGAGTPEQGVRLGALAEQLSPRYASAPASPVPVMPGYVPAELLPAPEGDAICIGVEDDVVGGVSLHLLDGPLLVAGRARSGRTSFLLGLVELAARSSLPPRQVTLLGPGVDRNGLEPGPARALTTPEQVMAWLDEREADLAGPGEWDLVVVDDAHEWERGWESGGDLRAMLERLGALAPELARQRTALVVAADVDDARSRQHVPALVAAVRRARRAVLLSPEMGDGALVGVQVPMTSHEPLSGIGRGLFVSQATAHVVQVLSVGQSGQVHQGGPA